MVNNIILQPEAMCIKDNSIWIVELLSNCLLRLNFTERKITETILMPTDISVSDSIISHVSTVDDFIVLHSNRSNEIWIYNIVSKLWKRLRISDDAIGQNLCAGFCVVNDKLILMPCAYGNTVSVDLSDLKIDIGRNIYRQLQNKYGESVSGINPQALYQDRLLLGVTSKDNLVFVFDLSGNIIEAVHIGKEGNCYSSISIIGDTIFLYEKCKSIVYGVNYYSKEIVAQRQIEGIFRLRNIDDDYIILDSLTNDYFIVMDRNLNTCYEYGGYAKGKISLTNLGIVVRSDNKSFYYNRFDNWIYSFQKCNMKKVFSLPCADEVVTEQIKCLINKKAITENNYLGLREFITFF